MLNCERADFYAQKRETYDKNGNIASEKLGKIGHEKTTSYKYDSNNRLIREDNEALGKSYEYEYDDSGNRTIMIEGAYSLGIGFIYCALSGIRWAKNLRIF